MTDKELQDLIGLKKYEQPEEGYFDDFLLEFQQRQRSEMLKTSARGLLIERIKAWFSEFGTSKYMPWLVGGGLAYATIALFLSSLPSNQKVTSTELDATPRIEGKETLENVTTRAEEVPMTVSMEYTIPVDFSSPKPVFATEEKFF